MMTNGQTPPRLSVILVGRDGYDTLRPILLCLAEQTISAQIEIVVLLPRPEEFDLPQSVLGSFQSLKSIVIGQIGNRGIAAAKGVAHATAKVIAFTENHCFPDPDWAETLAGAYDDSSIAGVGPAVLNANPEGALSWGSYVTGYAEFAQLPGSNDPREVQELPLHNTSYRAMELHSRGNLLAELMEDERRLQREIRACGGEFRIVTATATRHINEDTLYLAISLNWINGRRYGTRRAPSMGFSRRIAYALAFPAIAVPIFRNNIRRLVRADARDKVSPHFLLGLAAMSLAHAAGEAVAYLGLGREIFPFLDREEFMLIERLGTRPIADQRIARYVRLAKPINVP